MSIGEVIPIGEKEHAVVSTRRAARAHSRRRESGGDVGRWLAASDGPASQWWAWSRSETSSGPASPERRDILGRSTPHDWWRLLHRRQHGLGASVGGRCAVATRYSNRFFGGSTFIGSPAAAPEFVHARASHGCWFSNSSIAFAALFAVAFPDNMTTTQQSTPYARLTVFVRRTIRPEFAAGQRYAPARSGLDLPCACFRELCRCNHTTRAGGDHPEFVAGQRYTGASSYLH